MTQATIALWLLLAPPLLAATADGRLNNRTDPRIVPAGVEIEVLGLEGGMSILRSARTDASGRFRIEGLPDDERLMVRANYKSANYYGMLAFQNGHADVSIDVYETASSMRDITVEAVRMAFQVEGDTLKSVESVTLHNRTDPPRTFAGPEGTFRISKAPGILQPPRFRVTAPGATMPLVQSALESPDGEAYYSLYPLRPGVTTFEVEQLLPYKDRSYTYKGKFFQDAPSIDIGVTPRDVVLSGQGLSRVPAEQKDFAVYLCGPVRAGSEIAWTFSGGTSAPAAAEQERAGSSVLPLPDEVGRNALTIGPLMLLAMVLVLWYACNHAASAPQEGGFRRLKADKERLLAEAAALDQSLASELISRGEYLRRREEVMRRLRRVFALLGSGPRD